MISSTECDFRYASLHNFLGNKQAEKCVINFNTRQVFFQLWYFLHSYRYTYSMGTIAHSRMGRQPHGKVMAYQAVTGSYGLRALLKRVNLMKCLTLDKLFDYLKNLTDEREHATIAAHLATGCPDCNKSVKWLELVIRTAAEDQSFEFPEEVIAAIVAKFKELTAASQRPIRQYIAQLVFDRVLTSQVVEARPDSEEAAGRESLYHAGGYDIDLRFVFDENNNEQLIGQVLPERWNAPELTPFKVDLLRHGSLVSTTNTNPYGEFIFARLTSGTYDLKVSVPDGEINLEQVPTARPL